MYEDHHRWTVYANYILKNTARIGPLVRTNPLLYFYFNDYLFFDVFLKSFDVVLEVVFLESFDVVALEDVFLKSLEVVFLEES